MERLYHLTVAVLIVIFNHCLGEKTFSVDLITLPATGNPVIDLSEEDKAVKKCTVLGKDMQKYFICSATTIRLIKPITDGRTDIKVKISLETEQGRENGTVHLRVGALSEHALVSVDAPTMLEEMEPGSKINKLFALGGLKSGDKVKYRLQGEDSKYLKIDKDTGAVTSGEPVDRDGPKGVPYINRLTLTALVNEKKMLTLPLNITVLDINDNSPTFVKEVWNVEVKENSTKYLIATLKCTDLDEGDNAKIVQSISSPPGITLFSIKGESLVAETLDYEAIKDVNKTYVLKVIAVDQPKKGVEARTGTATVIVKVLPKNEFFPVWTKPFKGGSGATYTHTIYRNTKAGDVIFTLSAQDEDDGPDGKIMYNQSKTLTASGRKVPFVFHVMENGALHVLVDHVKEPSYTLIVFATDNGKPNKTINATLTIVVSDPPKPGLRWSQEIQKNNGHVVLDLPKDIGAGKTISSVVAEGVGNERISYEMGPVKMNGKELLEQYTFIVREEDGKLIALKNFKQYQNNGATSYTIIIYAKSGTGNDTHTIQCSVTLNIRQKTVNHAPKWVSPFVGGDGATGAVTIREDISPGSPVATVKAVDADPGAAGNITYRIGSIATDGGDDATALFSFQPNTGLLTVLSDIDLEAGVKSFTVMLSAMDRGDPQKTIHGILTIQISDVNEFPPKLDKEDMYITTIGCDVQQGDDVLKIKMTDKDATSHFKLTPVKNSSYVALEMLGTDSAALFLTSRPPPSLFQSDTFDEIIRFTLSDGGTPEKTTTGLLFVKFRKCEEKKKTPKPTEAVTKKSEVTKPPKPPKPTEIIVTKKAVVTDAPKPTKKSGPMVTEGQKQPIPDSTPDAGISVPPKVTPEVTSETDYSNTTDDIDIFDSTATESDVTASDEPDWSVHSSRAAGSTTYKPEGTKTKNNSTNTGKTGGSSGGGGGGGDDSGNWVVRSLCIILFMGYVGLGGVYMAKKYSLINLNCLRPKTAVHPRPEGENDTNDNVPGDSVVDYSERHADNMPDITAALAIASPNFMDSSYSRELPQPPVTATPSPVVPSPAVPPVPVIPAVPSPVPLPPIPSILTEPPPAVPPLSTTTSQMPPKFLPPLPEGVRKLPEAPVEIRRA